MFSLTTIFTSLMHIKPVIFTDSFAFEETKWAANGFPSLDLLCNDLLLLQHWTYATKMYNISTDIVNFSCSNVFIKTE